MKNFLRVLNVGLKSIIGRKKLFLNRMLGKWKGLSGQVVVGEPLWSSEVKLNISMHAEDDG